MDKNQLDKSLEDKLYDAVTSENKYAVMHWLSLEANPNKTSFRGKTSLGEAAYIGNINILKLLIEARKSNNTSSVNIPTKKRVFKSQKRKHTDPKYGDTVVKYKNINDRLHKEESESSELKPESTESILLKPENTQDKNQGYYVFVHSDGSSSDESRISSKKSPITPPSSTPSPQADLEWDEEIGNVAPTTKEDERWSSIYKWYAEILETTGAAIASASAMSYGIDQQDVFSRTALYYAAQQGHCEAVKVLIDAGCKIDIASGDGLTPLHVAVIRNHAQITDLLLAAGGQVNYKTHEKMTALHFASSRGHLDIVKILVRHGANLEARDTSERTALYLAAGRGHAYIAEYLIASGANVNGEEIHGYTPLCEAVWHRYASVVRVLLASGARITHSHKLLHNAIVQRQEEIVRLLVTYGGGINLHNDNGDTPLLLTARLSLPASARVLLENGANVNACNNITGTTALHIAVESIDSNEQLEELMTSLFEYKIDMNCAAITGDTALNRALLLHRDYAASLLIKHGADVNACDLHTRGLDNLSIARRRQKVYLANMLVKAGHYIPAPEPKSPVPKPGTTANWLYHLCRHPMSLSDLCRIEIRKSCNGRVMHQYVSDLPLPNRLKRFIMLEDESIM